MQITDTIADLLTRIRNASTAKHATEVDHTDPRRRRIR